MNVAFEFIVFLSYENKNYFYLQYSGFFGPLCDLNTGFTKLHAYSHENTRRLKASTLNCFTSITVANKSIKSIRTLKLFIYEIVLKIINLNWGQLMNKVLILSTNTRSKVRLNISIYDLQVHK